MHWRFLLGIVACTVWCSVSAAQSPRAPLGLNLAGVTDYASDIVFVDAFKAARGWISQAKGQPWGKGGPLDVDEHGHVRALRAGQYAETIIYTNFQDRFPAGTFTCFYDGAGELDFTGDARVTARHAGKLLVEIRPKSGQAAARITRTDPDNPVRNIRLIMPGFEKTHQDQPFHPDFLKRWQGFKVFRFMDWARTNGSKIADWSDRPTPATHSQALSGVALEYMIRLCNQLGVEPWFCLPHLASDDYVRQFARLVKEQLEPGRTVYIEYSNECWNGQFAQARYCQEQGTKLGLSENAYEAQLRFYAQRSTEIFNICEAELGGKRLVRVLAAQSANPRTGSTVLGWRDAYKKADAIAIAPYFGHRWGSPKTAERVAAMSVDELIAALPKDVADSKRNMDSFAELARKHNLRLVAYEGGQHLVGHQGAENHEKLTELLQAANRHAGMEALYRQNLRDWNDAKGDLFCVFSSMSRPSKWGSWGLLEHTGQNPQQVPKYRAIQQYLQGK